MMKYIITLFFFLLSIGGFGQDLTKEVKELFSADNVHDFEKAFESKSLEECYYHKDSNTSYSLLILSIKSECRKIFDFLINRVDIDKSCNEKTPLMYAAKYGRTNYAKALIAKGASKTKTNNGKTALDYAKSGNFTEIIMLLKA